jgi:hypothetical protein
MKPVPTRAASSAQSELLILPDGRVLVHNLTPTMASLLAELNPADPAMRERSRRRDWVTRRAAQRASVIGSPQPAAHAPRTTL